MRKILLFDEDDVCGSGDVLSEMSNRDKFYGISRVCQSRDEINSADVVAIVSRDGTATIMKSRDGMSGQKMPVECLAIRAVYGKV